MLSRLVVQSQPLMSMALIGRNVQKMPIRNQIIRQLHREGRETMSRSERISHRQSLKEKIMAPAGPNGIHSVTINIFILNPKNMQINFNLKIC